MGDVTGDGATDGRETVAVVLSGAGARGAFQAGALSVLVPALEERGLTPTIWLGTSAGSINAALWGASAHLGAVSAAERTLAVWRAMGDEDVYAPVPLSLGRALVQYAAGAVAGRGAGTTSLLDTTPLERTAREHLDTRRLAANVADGILDSVGVVATRMPDRADDVAEGAASGRSVLFLDQHSTGEYDGDPARALDVVRGPLEPEHVLASSAIPVAFPPARIGTPATAAGWYTDGGVRLNTPLQPAVGLGATMIVVVSATSTTYRPPPPPRPPGSVPDIADAAAQVLNATLADRTTEDLAGLHRINRLVAQASRSASPVALTDRSGRPYREIDVLAVAPPPGAMGRLAEEVHARRTDGLGRLAELDNWLLGKALRGAGDGVGRRELLSYLFFDATYFSAGIELGARSAAAALAGAGMAPRTQDRPGPRRGTGPVGGARS